MNGSTGSYRGVAGVNRQLLLLLAVLTCAAVLALACVGPLSRFSAGPTEGRATEVRLGDQGTGIFGLSVANTDGFSQDRPPARVTKGPLNAEVTAEQQHASDVAWGAACATWSNLAVLGDDQALACATQTARPDVIEAARMSGPSKMLAYALAYTDLLFDISGGVRVAATGELVVDSYTPGGVGGPEVRSVVEGVGGVPEKAGAAHAAGVDVLFVPPENQREFAAEFAELGSDVEPVPVASLLAAVRELCDRSRTEVCVAHVIGTADPTVARAGTTAGVASGAGVAGIAAGG